MERMQQYQAQQEGRKRGGRILALAYVEAYILRIPKWYDTFEINYGAEQAILLNKNQWIPGVPT